MSDNSFPQSFEELSHDQLVQAVLDGFRRTLVHFGLWHREVEHQLGMHNAMEIEAAAGDQFWKIMLKRLGDVLGFEIENGVPKALNAKSKDELLALLKTASVNWLVNDGVWFQAVENKFGMDYAKRANDTAWTRFSPYEANRIKKVLGLSDQPGLEGLKAALGHRLYAAINVQSIEEVDEKSFIFRMNECRVQNARKRRGLDDYPCKSGGLVEYITFAQTIDPRIKTECIGCPPDAHPVEWICAWRFTLEED